MPRETVQYASLRNTSPTEIEVCWSKQAPHVQLHVTRQLLVDMECPRGCTAQNKGAGPNDPKWGCTDCPPTTDPVPVGSLRASDDGHVARKDDGGKWNIFRREGGFEVVAEEQLMGWKLIWVPDDGVIPHDIYTEPMDRSALNKMIRVLRRARDDAYGADA